MAAKKSKAKSAAKSAAKSSVKSSSTKSAAVKAAMSKSQILASISESADLSKKQVQSVLDELTTLIEGHVKKKGGVGNFTLPGLLKITVINKPATKARKGINPFTGEETMFKAKPARNIVKIRALKKLKDMVV